jgi:hypothetical protein
VLIVKLTASSAIYQGPDEALVVVATAKGHYAAHIAASVAAPNAL